MSLKMLILQCHMKNLHTNLFKYVISKITINFKKLYKFKKKEEQREIQSNVIGVCMPSLFSRG